MSQLPEDRPRILVVDDEKVIRDMLADFLGMEGYVVRTAEDGTAALSELTKQHFDLVITFRQLSHSAEHLNNIFHKVFVSML